MKPACPKTEWIKIISCSKRHVVTSIGLLILFHYLHSLRNPQRVRTPPWVVIRCCYLGFLFARYPLRNVYRLGSFVHSLRWFIIRKQTILIFLRRLTHPSGPRQSVNTVTTWPGHQRTRMARCHQSEYRLCSGDVGVAQCWRGGAHMFANR